jgi:hypothetical protein
MKQKLSILLTLILVCIALNAHAEEKSLQQGEYKLIAYTLSNGSSDIYSEGSSSKSISFQSLYISPEAMNTVLNREDSFLNSSVSDINKGHYKGFVIRAAYAPTSSITFHSSFGLTDIMEDTKLDYTDRIGWEVDLGLAYKFLNHFAYEVHFGYMDTGELFRDSSSLNDVDNITIITNKLTMSF